MMYGQKNIKLPNKIFRFKLLWFIFKS